ncbi:MAG: putative Ig domain-containing protein [Propionibacteriaceae bacterium]|jgi:hypothetical protein|nr:putative Ig domain-containing protein [Propionibacteriaceae bacterium]
MLLTGATVASADLTSYDYADPTPGQPIKHTFYFVAVRQDTNVADPWEQEDAKALLTATQQYYSDQTGWDFQFEFGGFAVLQVPQICKGNVTRAAAESLGKTYEYFKAGSKRQLVMVHNGTKEQCDTGGSMSGADGYAGGGSHSDPEEGQGLVGAGGYVETYDRAADVRVLAHEIGHNFGLGHSGTYECSAIPGATDPWNEGQWRNCSFETYLDWYDFMSGALGSISASRQWSLGLLSAEQYQVVDDPTTSATITLSVPTQSNPKAKRVAIISDPAGGSDIVVEQRNASWYQPAGVFVSRLTDDHESRLLSAAGTQRQPLPAETTFTSNGSTVKVTVSSSSETTSTIKVVRSSNYVVSVLTQGSGGDNDIPVPATGAQGKTYKRTIKTDQGSWTATLESAAASWLKLNARSGANGDVLEVQPLADNPTSKERVAKITLQAGSAQSYVWVTQATNVKPSLKFTNDGTARTAFQNQTTKIYPAAASSEEPVAFTAKMRDGSALPSWIALDASTGVLTGNPTTSVAVDHYAVIVTAQAAGLEATATYTFKVAAATHNPWGAVDVVEVKEGAIRVQGWAADFDDGSKPLSIQVKIGDEAKTFTTHIQRADIPQGYPALTAASGFNETLTTAKRGNQTVTVTAINIGQGANRVLATKDVDLGYDPQGAFDWATATLSGSIRVRGWAADNDAPTTPLKVQVSVGGPLNASGAELLTISKADVDRVDVPRAYPEFGAKQGFNHVLSTSKRGVQDVYVYAVNAAGTGGTTKLLGKRTVTIGVVEGGMEAATAVKGKVTVKGWGADLADASKPVSVEVYLGGWDTAANVQKADLGKTTVERAAFANTLETKYPGSTKGFKKYGFSGTMTTTRSGSVALYYYARMHDGSLALLGIQTVNIPA